MKLVLALIISVAASAGCHSPGTSHSLTTPALSVNKTNYHGWPDSYVLKNGIVQTVVVPRIGRVMQFGFLGEEGVFWENRQLDGKELNCQSEQWINFGGDKTWPSPEAEWGQFTGRKNWHPPEAFDCRPLTGSLDGDAVVLTSPVDPHYGLRTVRRISLARGRPEMKIVTRYERVFGVPARIGIWVITQLKEPVQIIVPLPDSPQEIKDFVLLGKDRPPSLKIQNKSASLTRDSAAAHKLGFESSTLTWIGADSLLRIDSPRIRSVSYPDKGSSAEVYTNPDPLTYVELEMLGPLQELKPGKQISQTNRYTLSRVTQSEAIRHTSSDRAWVRRK